jgi:hypothetical protein
MRLPEGEACSIADIRKPIERRRLVLVGAYNGSSQKGYKLPIVHDDEMRGIYVVGSNKNVLSIDLLSNYCGL